MKKILTPVLFFLSTLSFAQQVAPVNPPVGGFHIDGNLQANLFTANVGDWLPGPAGSGGFVMNSSGVVIDTATTFHIVDAWSSNDDIFTSGRRNENPNTQWAWTLGSSNNKSDLNNLLIHFGTDTIVGCHKWVMFAGDRLSNSGSSYIDIELLQNILTKNLGGTFTSAASNATGGRTINDLLIYVEYTGGGGPINLSFYSWQYVGGVYQYVQFTPPAGKAFGFTSSGGESVPYGAFGNSIYYTNQFVEGAVDLEAIVHSYIAASSSIVFKTLFVKTKAGTTDQYSDFVTPKQLSNLTIDCATGIAETELQNAISISPNPAHGVFNVECALHDAQLKIYDAIGREVYQQQIHNAKSAIRNNFPAGIYFVKVSHGEKVYTHKLVIE